MDEQRVVDDFHELYYSQAKRTWDGPTSYKGQKILKCPLDLWIYQEIIWDMRPDLIVECGTAHGGSALWFCDQLETAGIDGRVITIDIENPIFFPDRPQHPRLEYINASSTAESTMRYVHEQAQGKRVLVVLDSAHTREHVLDELHAYSHLTPVGGYLIVEDTNVHGHPVLPTHAPGPMEALDEWLPYHPEFQVDESKHKFFLTFNPNGYLKRTSV